MADNKLTDEQKKKNQEQRKLIAKQNRKSKLLAQSILMLDLKNLVAMNRKQYAPDGYDNVLCVEDEDPASFTSKILGFNFLPINGLKNTHFSSLVPSVRFYKVLYGTNTKKDRHAFSKREEIVFPASMQEGSLEKRYKDRITFEPTSGSPNLGLRTVQWSNMGGSAYREKNMFTVNATLYAERMSDFFESVVGSSPRQELKYSDLFMPESQRVPPPEGTEGHGELNKDYFTIEMEVGWSVPTKNFEELNISSGNKRNIKTAMDILREQKTTISLQFTKMDFDIQQNGSVTMNLTFVGHLQKLLEHPSTNLVFESKEVMEKRERLQQINKDIASKIQNQKQKTGTFLKREKVQSAGGLSSEQKKELKKLLKKESEEINTLKTEIKAMQVDDSARLSQIIRNLLEGEKVKVLEKSALNGRIPDYKVEDFWLFEEDEDMSYCNKFEGDPPEGYEMVGIINVPPGSPISSPSSVDINYYGGFLKMMRNTTTNEIGYYYYTPNDQAPIKLDGKLFIKQEEMSALLKTFSSNQSFRQFQVENSESKDSTCTYSEIRPELLMNNGDYNSLMLKPNISTIKNDDNLKDYFKKFAAPTYDSKTKSYSIKYIYYGDLLDTVFNMYYKKYEKDVNSSNLRPVIGPVTLTNYDVSNIDYDHIGMSSEKFGQVFLEQDLDPVTKEKRINEIRKKIKKENYTANLADIPIALDSFVNWFNDMYASKSKLNFSFASFLRDSLKLVNRVTTAADKTELSIVPRQNINPHFQFVSVKAPVGKQEQDYFGFIDKPNKGSPFTHAGNKGRKKLSDIRSNSAADQSNPSSLRQSSKIINFDRQILNEDNQRVKTINYFILSSNSGYNIQRVPNYTKDCTEGIPHFFIGADSGFVKSINFSLQENQALLNDAYLRNATGEGPTLPVAGTFSANITMFGNVFMAPMTYIYINPLALGFKPSALSSNRKSIDKLLGISGYYAVHKVESYVEAGTYETKITARFIHPGLDNVGKEVQKANNTEKGVSNATNHLPFGGQK